jgi:hypothetical protein
MTVRLQVGNFEGGLCGDLWLIGTQLSENAQLKSVSYQRSEIRKWIRKENHK